MLCRALNLTHKLLCRGWSGIVSHFFVWKVGKKWLTVLVLLHLLYTLFLSLENMKLTSIPTLLFRTVNPSSAFCTATTRPPIGSLRWCCPAAPPSHVPTWISAAWPWRWRRATGPPNASWTRRRHIAHKQTNQMLCSCCVSFGFGRVVTPFAIISDASGESGFSTFEITSHLSFAFFLLLLRLCGGDNEVYPKITY